MNKLTNRFTSIEQVTGEYLHTSKPKETAAGELSFEEILRQRQSDAASELKFSKHASMRLMERNISLTKEQNDRLESGVQKAVKEGIKVNVPNKTVVTAMDQTETPTNIFTNIDGAVIM